MRHEHAQAAAEMRILGLLFGRPTPASRVEVMALAREIEDPALRSISDGFGAADEGSYVARFGPGGPVSPREVAYRRREDPGWVMADVAAFYAAFGYRPRCEDPIDHVSVETGFVAYLWLKQLYAETLGEGMEVTANARVRFVKSHLSTLAAGLVARLQELQAPPMVALAQALLDRTGSPEMPPSEAAGSGTDEELTCGPCGQAAP